MTSSPRAGAFYALAISILATVPATAAVLPTRANGDLFLGFRATGGQGASTSYLVKLGNQTAFQTTEGFTLTPNIGNIGLDLAGTYGSSWFNRSDLYWGIFGTTTSASSSVYGSRERVSPGVKTDPWPVLTGQARNATDTAISSVLDSAYIGNSTSNSPVAIFQNNSALPSSYAFQVGSAGTTDFGSVSGWTSIEGDFADGAAATVLDLWRLSGSATSPATYRGAFSINNTGVVTYSFNNVVAAPVPEAATTFWGLGALGALGLTRARRPRQTLADAAV